MNYRLFILWLFCSIASAGSGHSQELSDQAEISLLSFGPGTEVYAIWGHTAIRVYDPMQRLDKVYNYGTFDFDTPNFTLKFIQGKLDYTLSTQRYRHVIAAYKSENRWIREQYLDLTQLEKTRLYVLLEENYREENRHYKYDFLYDNCATRPVEIILKSVQSPIYFDPGDSIKTYRNILDEHLIFNPWVDFGVDLIIGVKADQQIAPEQQMFMPVYINRYFNTAIIQEVPPRKLVKEERLISETMGESRPKPSGIISPFNVFLFLLLIEIALFLYGIRKGKFLIEWYDKLWFTGVFLGSMLLLFMWFGTDHVPTKNNWNLLWMNPLFLFLLPFFSRRIRQIGAVILFFVLFAVLISWYLIPQAFHVAAIPVIGILGFKLFKLAFLKHTLRKKKGEPVF